MRPTRQTISALRTSLLSLAGLGIVACAAASAEAQTTERTTLDLPTPHIADPRVPQGRILFEIAPSWTGVRGLYGDDGERPLGAGFFLTELGTTHLPQFTGAEERFRELAETGSAWHLNLGAVSGRFEAEEQRLPLRIGYGLSDRLSLGVTGHFVRRRVATALTLAGTGANVGANPSTTDNESVQSFLQGAQSSLNQLESAVAAVCDEEPSGTACLEGEELLQGASSFVSALAQAYDAEIVFPLAGGSAAGQLSARWTGFQNGMSAWSVEAPDALPLATRPLQDGPFAASAVDPWWGPEGFPRETPDVFMRLADIDLHAVVGVIDSDPAGGRYRLRSTLVASARIPLGQADSLQLVAPLPPPRGVAGAGLRLVTDVTDGGRFGLLTVVDGWWFGSTDTFVLAADPSRLLGEGAVPRTAANWSPGATLSLSVTPRFHVVPSISLGAGYRFELRGEDSFTEIGESTGITFAGSGASLHRLNAEFRYHGFEGAIAEALPFPIELAIGFDGTVAGSGDLAPRESRVHAALRVLRER